MKEHTIVIDPDDYPAILVKPATPDDVKFVLEQGTAGNDGRSDWAWVTLPDGTLILGAFPMGDTYETVVQKFT